MNRRKHTPLYKKDTKQNQDSPMETTKVEWKTNKNINRQADRQTMRDSKVLKNELEKERYGNTRTDKLTHREKSKNTPRMGVCVCVCVCMCVCERERERELR